jgi:hypothetical protein
MLVPMATSPSCGILFATAITPYLIPATYVAAEDFRAHLGRAWQWYKRPFARPDDLPALADAPSPTPRPPHPPAAAAHPLQGSV